MKRKLRIAIVISHPIQHFCPQYVSFTENKNIEFKVFFASTLGYKNYVDVNFGKEISWGNLQLNKFAHIFLNGEALLQADKNLDAPSLNNQLDEYKPDIIFTYGYFQKLQRRAYQWALKNKVKIAYISDSELRHKRNPAKEFLKSIFLKRYFSKIDFFLTMGNANEDFYKKYGVADNKLIRMHYPIDLVVYQKSYDQKELLRKKIRSQYQIHENEIVISVVGKLVEWKNQDHIIEAMKLLENEGIYLTLFILGSGEMKENWEEKSKELKKSKVFFPGFVNIEELPFYYAATDIYIHPASMEPHSVAISEAIIMGCPIILSDKCGSYGEDDDVQEGKNGYVFEFGNIEHLAHKIKLLAMNDERRKRFSDYSHQVAVAFQQRSHFGIITNILKELQKKGNFSTLADSLDGQHHIHVNK
jgi:glycosyltransferase involved in cell wall biosynthesis